MSARNLPNDLREAIRDYRGCSLRELSAHMDMIGRMYAEALAARLSESEQREREAVEKWNYYQEFCKAHGADGITNLVVQRDEAVAYAERLRHLLREAMEWNWLDDDIEQHCDVAQFKAAIDVKPPRPSPL